MGLLEAIILAVLAASTPLLIAAAGERDRAFRAALSAEELAVLETALNKLVTRARGFIEAETETETQAETRAGAAKTPG